MSSATTYVRARIDSETKTKAVEALTAMGLSVSDAIRLLMIEIANEHRLPFEIKAPSVSSQTALSEIADGQVKSFNNLDDFMDDLNADD